MQSQIAVEAGTHHLKTLKLLLASMLLSLFAASQIMAAPINDNFAKAIPLSAATQAGTDLGATLQTGEPHANGVTNTVWWLWTAPHSGLAYIDLNGGNGGNYYVQVFTGLSVNFLNEITGNPFQASVGATYYIQVSGYDGSDISISLQPDGMRTSALQHTPNPDYSEPFSANVEVANAGTNAQNFEVDIVARAGYSATQRYLGSFDLPSDQLLASYYVTNLAPGALTNIFVTNTCPAMEVLADNNANVGWDIFVNFTGTYQTSTLLFNGAWPNVSGDTNAGGEVSRYDPSPTNVAPAEYQFVSGSIIGPDTVDENSSTNFSGSVNITNGFINTTLNLANAYWTISPASPFTIDSNGVFTCGLVTTNTPVTITAYYSLNGTNYPISTNFTVIVIPAPAIINEPASTNIGFGQTTEFSVAATGHPPLFYQWAFDGSPILDATNSVFDITNAQFTNSGTYSVVVSNSVGSAASTNVTLTVAETEPPTVTIVSPNPAGPFHTLDFLATISGVATDPVGLTEVLIKNNNGAYEMANGTSNWSATLALAAGSNVISVKSVNLSSLISAPATITIIRDGAPGADGLALITNGAGTITQSGWPKQLISGKKYTAVAVPKPGNLFSNWIGGTGYPYAVLSTSTKYSFVMAGNLLLEASFVTNPFVAITGVYNGIFTNTNGVAELTAGMLKGLSITAKGAYTGSLLVNGSTFPLSGSFSLGGQATNYLTRKTGAEGPLTVAMSFTNGDNSPAQIIGTVSGVNNNVPWSSTLTASRAGNAPLPASYTLLVEPGASVAPAADGYALITDVKGTAKISGSLADGTAFSQSVGIAPNGDVPVYANLYKNKGLLLGWINLDPTNPPGPGLAWIHPALATGLFQSPFSSTNPIALSAWTNPPANEILANLNALSIADPMAINLTITNNFAITINGYDKITASSGPETVTGTLAPKTGLVTLTIGEGKTKETGHAVILPNATNAAGFILTKTNIQSIQIGQ
jgi:hypothetical protein